MLQKANIMKLKHSLLTLLAVVMLPATPVQGTVDSFVTALNLSLLVQSELESEDGILEGKTANVRLGAKQILELLEDELETDFPAGSRLFIALNGDILARGIGESNDVLVVDKKGNELANVSDYITAFIDFENSTFKGFYNELTDQEKSVIHFLLGYEISLPTGSMVVSAAAPRGGKGIENGIDLEVFGIAKENFKGSKPKNDGTQNFTGKISARLIGLGTVDGANALANGNTSLSGKETVDGKLDFATD